MIWICGYKTKPLSEIHVRCQSYKVEWHLPEKLALVPHLFSIKKHQKASRNQGLVSLRFRIYNPHDFVAVLKKTHGNTNCGNDRRTNETHFGSKLVASTKIWLRKGLIEEPRMQGRDSPLKLWTTNNHNPLHHSNPPLVASKTTHHYSNENPQTVLSKRNKRMSIISCPTLTPLAAFSFLASPTCCFKRSKTLWVRDMFAGLTN